MTDIWSWNRSHWRVTQNVLLEKFVTLAFSTTDLCTIFVYFHLRAKFHATAQVCQLVCANDSERKERTKVPRCLTVVRFHMLRFQPYREAEWKLNLMFNVLWIGLRRAEGKSSSISSELPQSSTHFAVINSPIERKLIGKTSIEFDDLSRVLFVEFRNRDSFEIRLRSWLSLERGFSEKREHTHCIR